MNCLHSSNRLIQNNITSMDYVVSKCVTTEQTCLTYLTLSEMKIELYTAWIRLKIRCFFLSDYSLIILEWTPRVEGKLVMLPWRNREWLISIATTRILIAFVARRNIFLGWQLLIQYSSRRHFEIGTFFDWNVSNEERHYFI